MVAELTAVRLLAPWFGDSAYVWTNVIGVILAALAGGAMLGGRWAGGGDPARITRRLCAVAAANLAIVPWVAPWLGAWLMPSGLPLDAAMPALERGSFVATGLLFAPPLFVIGALTPLLLTVAVSHGVPIGRAAGRISAAGTLGSLLGTFLATHWLVPTFGCRITLLVAGTALALAAVVGRRGRANALASLVILPLAAAPWLPQPLRPAPAGRQCLAEVESRTQFLQVQRETDAQGHLRTLLLINEGLDSFHSLAVHGSVLTDGAYYDWHALAPLLAGDGKRPAGLRALSIGDAAGTLRGIYAAVHPGAVVDAVDIDGAPMQLGAQHFPMTRPAGSEHVLDGRVFLSVVAARWHTIHVDAYAHQAYVPAHLASREFFLAVKERLLPSGVVACNVGALSLEDPVLVAIGATLRGVFGHALAFQVPNSRNALLVARKDAPLQPTSLRDAGDERIASTDADIAHWQHLLKTAAEGAAWREMPPGDALVDDRPELDRLLLRSYFAVEDGEAALACDGGEDPTGAESAAFTARAIRDWHGVLRAVAGSRSETAYLREQAGDARWGLRQLHSAIAEYERAMPLAEGGAPGRITRKLGLVREQLEPIARARETGTRNGVLLGGLLVLAIAVFASLWLGTRRTGGPIAAD